MEICYVIINTAFDGWCKVGITTKSTMKNRLSTYQTGDPHRGYSVLYERSVVNSRLVEKEVHSRLSDISKRKGEWFCANSSIVCNIIDSVIDEIDSGLLNSAKDYDK